MAKGGKMKFKRSTSTPNGKPSKYLEALRHECEIEAEKYAHFQKPEAPELVPDEFGCVDHSNPACRCSFGLIERPCDPEVYEVPERTLPPGLYFAQNLVDDSIVSLALFVTKIIHVDYSNYSYKKIRSTRELRDLLREYPQLSSREKVVMFSRPGARYSISILYKNHKGFNFIISRYNEIKKRFIYGRQMLEMNELMIEEICKACNSAGGWYNTDFERLPKAFDDEMIDHFYQHDSDHFESIPEVFFDQE